MARKPIKPSNRAPAPAPAPRPPARPAAPAPKKTKGGQAATTLGPAANSGSQRSGGFPANWAQVIQKAIQTPVSMRAERALDEEGYAGEAARWVKRNPDMAKALLKAAAGDVAHMMGMQFRKHGRDADDTARAVKAVQTTLNALWDGTSGEIEQEQENTSSEGEQTPISTMTDAEVQAELRERGVDEVFIRYLADQGPAALRYELARHRQFDVQPAFVDTPDLYIVDVRTPFSNMTDPNVVMTEADILAQLPPNPDGRPVIILVTGFNTSTQGSIDAYRAFYGNHYGTTDFSDVPESERPIIVGIVWDSEVNVDSGEGARYGPGELGQLILPGLGDEYVTDLQTQAELLNLALSQYQQDYLAPISMVGHSMGATYVASVVQSVQDTGSGLVLGNVVLYQSIVGILDQAFDYDALSNRHIVQVGVIVTYNPRDGAAQAGGLTAGNLPYSELTLGYLGSLGGDNILNYYLGSSPENQHGGIERLDEGYSRLIDCLLINAYNPSEVARCVSEFPTLTEDQRFCILMRRWPARWEDCLWAFALEVTAIQSRYENTSL